jgi:PKD repeat protein
VLSLALLVFVLPCSAANISVSHLDPANVTEGGPAFTLDVHGAGFSANSTILWDGVNQTTQYIQPDQVSMAVPAVYITQAGLVNIAVYDSSLGEYSNVVYFEVLESPPVASFTANQTFGPASLPVQFTDTSLGDNITQWSWNFGDGGNATDQNPVHVYTVPGTYTVSLEVTNAGGSNTSTRTGYIMVFDPAPLADFTATPTSGGEPLAVQFYDTSTGSPTTWQWNFGDGAISPLQSPAHTYTAPGTYTVTLTAGTSGGSTTMVKPAYIQVSQLFPVADFSGTPTFGGIPLMVNFTDLSTGAPTTWSWDFGDGNNSTDPDPSHAYASPGIYTVNLTVSNAYGSDSLVRPEYILAAEFPHADFNASATTLYTNQYVDFFDLSTGDPTEYFWDFGDGMNASWSEPWHSYYQPGNYTVSLTVTNLVGNDTETKTDYITVTPAPPEAWFMGEPLDGTFPLTVFFRQYSWGGYFGNLTYLWDFGDGTTSDSPDYEVVHTYMQTGVYTVNLTVSADGQSNTLSRVDYIGNRSPPPPVAGFTATPQSGIAPLSVSFIDQSSGSPPLSFAWNFGDNITSVEQNPVHVYTAPGTYSVTLITTNAGGSSTAYKEDYITVGAVAPLEADFSANVTNGTLPLAVQFIDESTGDPGAWSWAFQKGSFYILGDGTVAIPNPLYGYETSAERNPVVLYTSPGNFTVSLTVSRTGETDSVTKEGYIQVDPPAPQVDFGAWPREGPAPLEVEFYENVPYWYYYDEYLWDFGDGTNGTGNWLYHTYTEPGLYNVTLTVTSAYGNGTLTKTDFINVTTPIPPVPDFEGTPLAGNAPLDVTFSDTSAGVVTTRFWDFGDGTTAWSNATPSIPHTYPFPGTYTVALTAGNDGGQATATKLAYIQVNPSGSPPYAAFMMRPSSGVVPLMVVFTDRSRGTPTAWLWDFGDGSTSTEQNPVHTYASVGTYTVRLTASNSGGSSSYASFVWVRAPRVFLQPGTPTPTPTVTPTPVIPPQAGRVPISFFLTNTSFGFAPMTVQFTDFSFYNPTSWEWEFGDGGTSPVRNPVHTYTTPGTYTVLLTAANAQGGSTSSRLLVVR